MLIILGMFIQWANFFEYNNVADSIYCLYKISESIKGGTAKEVWKTIYSLSEEKRFFAKITKKAMNLN